jgi:hypothetical protein
VNRLAISYAWNCSHVASDGKTELVDTYALAFLLAIAYRIPSQSRYETEPTTLLELRAMTRMSDRHLRSTRDLLAGLGEIAPGGADDQGGRPWPKHAVYQLPGLAGPLFVVTPWDVDVNPAQRAAFRSKNSAPRAAKSAQCAANGHQNAAPRAGQTRHSVPRSDLFAGGVYSGTSVLRSTNHHDDEAPPVINAAAQLIAEELFDWLVAEYPTHNGGATLTTSKSTAMALLLRLLGTGRTLDKLKAMAVALWTCDVADRGAKWIASTDRSLRVLWEARDTLDHLVSRTARAATAPAKAAACLYRHDPPCESAAACQALERARAEAGNGSEAVAR